MSSIFFDGYSHGNDAKILRNRINNFNDNCLERTIEDINENEEIGYSDVNDLYSDYKIKQINEMLKDVQIQREILIDEQDDNNLPNNYRGSHKTNIKLAEYLCLNKTNVKIDEKNIDKLETHSKNK